MAPRPTTPSRQGAPGNFRYAHEIGRRPVSFRAASPTSNHAPPPLRHGTDEWPETEGRLPHVFVPRRLKHSRHFRAPSPRTPSPTNHPGHGHGRRLDRSAQRSGPATIDPGDIFRGQNHDEPLDEKFPRGNPKVRLRCSSRPVVRQLDLNMTASVHGSKPWLPTARQPLSSAPPGGGGGRAPLIDRRR